MEFSPFNHVVKLCLQGMDMEEKGKPAEAKKFFMQGWSEASNDFEKFLAAYHIARQQNSAAEKLEWFQTTLQFALNQDNESVKTALPTLYFNIAKCYEDLHEHNKAKENYELGISAQKNPSDKGPFYHGTKADLKIGDLLIAGSNSNYQSELKMNHIYFTALLNGAGLAAALVKGDGEERVYIVDPTGSFENDPNLTDKKFPGNPSRSYRSEASLKIIGEATEWVRPAQEELQKFRDKLASNSGEIIN